MKFLSIFIPTMSPKETVDFHIRWAWQAISRHYNGRASEFGGTMSIGYALLNIDREGTPSTSLGPKMGMEATSLSRTLKKMEEEGLIRREKDQVDKRKVHLFLTDLGEQMREQSRRTVIDFNNAIREMVSEKELKTFFKVMSGINEVLETTPIEKVQH